MPRAGSTWSVRHAFRRALWPRSFGRPEIMTNQTSTDEAQIRALLEAWADGVRRHDLPAILAHHTPDVLMFDLPPPLQCKGLDAYAETWALLFRYHQPGAAFDFRELDIT